MIFYSAPTYAITLKTIQPNIILVLPSDDFQIPPFQKHLH